jgi:hypothetical protein
VTTGADPLTREVTRYAMLAVTLLVAAKPTLAVTATM